MVRLAEQRLRRPRTWREVRVEQRSLESSRSEPATVEAIEAVRLAALFGKVAGARVLLAPAIASLAVGLAILDPTPWRRALLVLVAAGMVTLSVVEVLRFRRTGLGAWTLHGNLVAMVLGQLLVTFATGGIESPLMPLVLPMAMVNALISGPGPAWLLVPLMQAGAVVLFTILAMTGGVPDLVPAIFGGGARAGHGDVLLLTQASLLLLMLGGASGIGAALRRVFDTMVADALESRAEVLASHAEQAQELQALSGEIAHELKNPLASIKGLAALLARELTADRPAERLTVLRAEVDRMQGILDEFLNFSRPLVPLSCARADLLTLGQEVALLHEGMAREARVSIEVLGEPTPCVCDARKLRQVLINLVQNGLQASPPGSTLWIEVHSSPDGPRIGVRDQGPGLDPVLAARIFEPGVTGRPDGSGLGLTIARALCRQHGGDLVLLDQDPGCMAEIRLPGKVAA